MIRALFALLLGLSLIACAAPEVVEDPLANLEVPPGTDVTLQGVTVHYRDVGEGVPVVLLHGAARCPLTTPVAANDFRHVEVF